MPTKASKATRVLFVGAAYALIYALLQTVMMIATGMIGIYFSKPFSAYEAEIVFSETALKYIFVSTIAAMYAALVLYIALGRLRERSINDDIRFGALSSKLILSAILTAFGCRLGVCVYTVLAEKIPVLYESVENSLDYGESLSTPGLIKLYFYASMIAAPIFEEILFRGFIQSELMRGFRPAGAIFFSALIFALAHGVLFQSLFTFFVGLMLGWFYYKTQNLFVTMIIHIAFNVSSIITLFFDNTDPLTLIVFSVIALALIVAGVITLRHSLKERFSANQ